MSLAHFEIDPRYGGGAYRRSIRFQRRDDAVIAIIEDTHHSMWILLRHRDGIVVSIDAAIERGPATSCGGAPEKLSAIVGAKLDASTMEVTAMLPPSENCTHLADLLRWALRVAQNGAEEVEYDIVVPDQTDEPVWIEISRNGRMVHRWQVEGETILAPAALAGRPVLRGFLRWAKTAFEGDDLEAAVMLQRGAWVARGRRYIVDRTIVPLRAATGMNDACYSYSGVNWDVATNNLGYVRNFSDGLPMSPLPLRLLKILGDYHHAAN